MAPRRSLITDWPILRMVLMAGAGFTGFYVTLAALPAWIASRGGSTTSAGAATTVMLATTAVCQPFVPALLRRMSTTSAVAIGALALGVPAPLLAWAGTGGGLYAICAIRGIGFAIFTIAGTLSTAELAPEGRLGEVAGLYGLGGAIPNVALVPVSVLLLHLVGYWPVAVISGAPILGGALALGAGWGRPDREHHARERRPGDARAAIRRSLAPAVVLCALTIAGGAIVTILPIERAGFVATAGLAVFGASSAAARWAAGTRSHRVLVLLPIACVCGAGGLLAIAAGLSGDASAAVIVGCTIAGAGFGAVQSLTLVAAFARTERRSRSVASAVWNMSVDSGTAAGALLIGVLTASSIGIWGSFSVLAALALVVVPVAVAAGRGT
jgi:Major Facilitator Superfamily